MQLFFSNSKIGSNESGTKEFSLIGPGNPDARILGVFVQPAGGGDFNDVFSSRVKSIGWNSLAGFWEARVVVRREDNNGGDWGMNLGVDALWVYE